MKVVYATLYNADTCEGRGPMVIDKVFSNRRDAAAYIDNKPGVMGRRGKWSEEKYGDWKIEEYPVFDCLAEARQSDEKIKKEKALAKLTEEDKRALGLA